jgi:lipopolysaccharide transport system ATP-binding protein
MKNKELNNKKGLKTHQHIHTSTHSFSSDIAIKVENVSKKYCKSLKRSMLYGVKDIARNSLGLSSNSHVLRKEEFWAVDNVSFELKRGETLGLIGPNGAGKTTILKMLNGIFWPDKGKITIKGRVGALIAVGAGFHPMLSGRENIYLNAAIIGMGREEVDRKFDAIVEFAEIGDFLDSPVKFYSSGMFVRLGFSVAVHANPEILLVDEILAVGDKDFQIKCYQKMHDIKKRGTTIILVSHNEYTIREQTKICLYINRGKMKFLGSSEEAISLYLKDLFTNKSKASIEKKDTKKRRPAKKSEIISLKFYDKNWNEITFIESGEEVNIVLECVIRENLNKPIFGINFYDKSGFMYCANSDYENIQFKKLSRGTVKIKINIHHFYMPSNNYLCSAIIAEENISNLIDWHNMAYRLVVGRAKNARGSIKLPTKWSVENLQKNG